MDTKIYSPQGEIDPELMAMLQLHIDWKIQVVGEPVVLPPIPVTWLRIAKLQQVVAKTLAIHEPTLILITNTSGDWMTILPWLRNLCQHRSTILITEVGRRGYTLNSFNSVIHQIVMTPLTKQKIRRVK